MRIDARWDDRFFLLCDSAEEVQAILADEVPLILFDELEQTSLQQNFFFMKLRLMAVEQKCTLNFLLFESCLESSKNGKMRPRANHGNPADLKVEAKGA